ncbi:DUF3037 domain-containing protein [Caballeronia sp. ATUFL_M2_KS44]|uniref:DUF3037 domain-containing protein n=1 Tax=Caballeronia sp. ATUFL_M2_KS44 TaxID=2921767 RepID=UPI0020293C4C|nr:DUF3037 domain-containing protein [Caballeronia sp. ATUFL_M2_KS44]
MKHACRYALVRFMPYAETGEFANVGVVLMSPTARYFGFKLLDRVGRITSFFDELDAQVYKRARDVFKEEMHRIGEMAQRAFIGAVNGPTTDFANFAFDQLVIPQQAIIYADMPRAALVEEPHKALNEFFDYYVGRSFVTPVYQERVVEQRVRNILKAADLQNLFQARVLGTEYQARLPFVHVNEKDEAVKLIKPLDLDRKDPTKIYDHGWEWLGKIKKLERDGQLVGEALFAVRVPEQRFGPTMAAYAEVKEVIKRAGVKVVEDQDKDAIVEFASE